MGGVTVIFALAMAGMYSFLYPYTFSIIFGFCFGLMSICVGSCLNCRSSRRCNVPGHTSHSTKDW